MKLIDATRFKDKLSYLKYELYNSHPVGELSEDEKDLVGWYIHHISNMVDNMPVESAIPIEWLKNDLIPKAENLGATDYVNNIRFVLEDWEAWKKYHS